MKTVARRINYWRLEEIRRARDLEGLEFTKDLRITHIKALTSVYKFKGL